MATTRYPSNDLRRQVGSPRSKGRENKDTLCRNILIYGNCRYEDQGCAFNHDQNKNPSPQAEFSKKTFNVDSPAFTPSNQSQVPAKKTTLSSQAANAAPFTPRGAGTPNLQQTAEASVFNPAAIREFTPQNYDVGNANSNGVPQENGIYSDPFTTMSSLSSTLPSAGQYNLYASDHNSLGGPGAQFYPQHGTFPAGPLQPPNYHLYQPHDSYRQELQPWQRATYDFFIPAKLREELQKKMFATQQVMPNSGLPQLERWHSLFPLDTNNRKNTSSFGFPSWVYKAQNSRTGRHYALRRLEGYRLTNEKAILSVMKEWKKIKNANVVTVHEAFTTREFGDSSLIFAYDYHPLSKTLQEHHLQPTHGNRYRTPSAVPENVLWGYICQITNALKTIHSNKLAARCLEPSKIILSDNHRIRLSACSILDVVQFESNKLVSELQQEDLVKFGKLILGLATGAPPAHLNNIQVALDSLVSKYSANLKDAVGWLIAPSNPGEPKSIENFISGIAAHMTTFFDLALQDNEEKQFHLARELENGRIARIMMKLMTIIERGELGGVQSWSETGDRYQLKLFRDYVFHRVEADGKPSLAMGHMLSCLSKLDAGIDEMVVLTSRDNETVFVLSYRELKQMFDRAFNELVKHSKTGAPGANNWAVKLPMAPVLRRPPWKVSVPPKHFSKSFAPPRSASLNSSLLSGTMMKHNRLRRALLRTSPPWVGVAESQAARADLVKPASLSLSSERDIPVEAVPDVTALASGVVQKGGTRQFKSAEEETRNELARGVSASSKPARYDMAAIDWEGGDSVRFASTSLVPAKTIRAVPNLAQPSPARNGLVSGDSKGPTLADHKPTVIVPALPDPGKPFPEKYSLEPATPALPDSTRPGAVPAVPNSAELNRESDDGLASAPTPRPGWWRRVLAWVDQQADIQYPSEHDPAVVQGQ